LFHDANRVYLRYCSSDLWTGTRRDTVPIEGLSQEWRFNGRFAVTATLGILRRRYGLTDAEDRRVLFSGGSAGAVGAVANADQLLEVVPQTVGEGRARVVTDGGFLPEFDLPGYRMDRKGRSDAEIMVTGYDTWSTRLNSDCELAERAMGHHASRCFLGFRSAPHLISRGMPVLVQQSLHDKWAITNHHIDVDDPSDARALDLWRESTLSALQDMPWVYSRGGAPYHTLLTRDVKPTPGSFGEVLVAFWRGDSPIRVVESR